jgi:hypothetical protein
MSAPQTIFRRYSSPEQAREIEKLLNDNNIPTAINDNTSKLDASFSGGNLQNQFELIVETKDFEKAEKILEQNAELLISQVDENYYLYDFSDEELYEILLKSDEWSELDNKLAVQILQKRGKAVDTEILNVLKKERLQVLSKPEESQTPWIIVGYIAALLGGLIGIAIGYSIWKAKKTLPNGQSVYSYNENDRREGKRIFILGLILLPIYALIRLIIP